MYSEDNEKYREAAMIAPNPKYGRRVKIGNWNEELFLHEAKNRLICSKMARNELLVQQTRTTMWNLCLEVTLSSEFGPVKFGQTVQIKCPKIPVTPKVKRSVDQGLYLSGVVTHMEVSQGNLTHGCGCSLTSEDRPCVRNTFMFWPVNDDEINKVINYEDPVYICMRLNNNSNNRLYVTTKIPLLDDPPAPNDQYPIRLVEKPDRYSRWMLQHVNPNARFEMVGSAVAANEDLVITNVATGRNLACENEIWFPTFFGLECAVTCHTYRDAHRKEMPQNIWQICNTLKSDKVQDYELLRATRNVERKN